MGAGLIDCDTLAHTLYRKGEPLQEKLVEYFGRNILDADGEIDRKVLGSIVFHDKVLITSQCLCLLIASRFFKLLIYVLSFCFCFVLPKILKAKLAALNDLLWPALWERTKQEISKLHRSGHNIVVVEAAILRLAGWDQHCHEVWVSIIPAEEVTCVQCSI